MANDPSKLVYYGKEFTADVRRVRDMESVIMDKEWARANPDVPLYYMFRNLFRSENDRDMMQKLGVRYCRTTILPVNLGREFNKTLGHGHAVAKNGLTYPEIYEVLDGKAHFVFQRVDGRNALEVILIRACKGDRIIVPPNMEHFTINPTNQKLELADIAAIFPSDYRGVVERQGAAYFELSDGSWLRNPNYEKAAEIVEKRPDNEIVPADIYLLIENPEMITSLKDPKELQKLMGV